MDPARPCVTIFRLRRGIQNLHANRRLVSSTDPSGQQTQFGYERDGRLISLTDPRTNVTSWTYDVQGRPTTKQYREVPTLNVRNGRPID
jgi:YD repeat-containing protein